MKRSLTLVPLALVAIALAADEPPKDNRVRKPKDLNGYFPMTVPASKEAWEARRKELREQVQVATGLWPMPDRPPLQPTIHGKIDRGDYTIEKVFFASYPGHYVCGNLYRPKGDGGKRAGVLCPHGHWNEGRFHDELKSRGEKYIAEELKSGAEQTREGTRYPLQAMCAQLARMGCVVFHYDMVGYADSKTIGHSTGFTDAQAELRLQSFMGLQTFNTIRALDFLVGLPDVDSSRIGVTGGSGGGTQTFILCAIDDRPTAAFPAVMVSTGMQGGCICENCSLLRIGCGNIDLAGLFVPKPLGMTGANDWTKEIETKGLPELKALYRLYDAEENVMAKCYPQFGHNYNQVSRELMYNWFNKHLKLGHPEPIKEKPFEPVPPKELSVFDEQHPLPNDAVGADGVRKTITAMSDEQVPKVHPKDATTLSQFRNLIGPALRVMVNDTLPETSSLEARDGVWNLYKGRPEKHNTWLKRRGEDFETRTDVYTPDKSNGTVVVWVRLRPLAGNDDDVLPFAKRGAKIISPWLIPCFEDHFTLPVDAKYAGYTFGYNRPLVARRVHDILSTVAYAKKLPGTKQVHLVGIDEAGPLVILARALCGDAVSRTVADVNKFRFDDVQKTADEMMLPGALKYGGLPAFAALCAPGDLYLHNHQGTGIGRMTKDAYTAAGAADKLHMHAEKLTPDKIVEWILR